MRDCRIELGYKQSFYRNKSSDPPIKWSFLHKTHEHFVPNSLQADKYSSSESDSHSPRSPKTIQFVSEGQRSITWKYSKHARWSLLEKEVNIH